MKRILQDARGENLAYLLVWIAVFVISAIAVLIQGLSAPDGTPPFNRILQLWLRILPFLVLFVLHNHLAAPLLFKYHKTWAYVAAALGLLVLFGVFLFSTQMGPDPSMRPPEPPGGMAPPPEMRGGPAPLKPEVLKLLLGVMLLAASLGVKYQFQAARSAARVQELENEKLQHRLDTLRYQINPHFFMNTLNNIHALVDIDPDKAKESIVELSRLMRHILYDSGAPTIPLSQEIEFLRHYMSLMRIRYAEGVDLSLELPLDTEGAVVPPLVYSSFLENAFKHGVSYEHPSFIHVRVALDSGRVVFRCANSRQAPVPQPDGSGLGQENVRHRLNLIYGEQYSLQLSQSAGEYIVCLVLPVQPPTP